MRKTRSHTYIGKTTSTCPDCLRLVQAKIVSENNNVYFIKYCSQHGSSRALVSEDVNYYLNTKNFAHPGSIPLEFSTQIQNGCPFDCGLCPDHEQHCCHPIVEITDTCNLDCPICIANNQDNGFLSVEKFQAIVDNLVKTEGVIENLTLSGGEPTLHPHFQRLIEIANRPEISRVSLVTNGIKLAQDMDFCRRIKEKNVYVILQWDGFDDNVYMALRGKPLLEIKKNALNNLEKLDIQTQLIFVAARNINDHQIGDAIRLLLDKPFLLSLAFQPLAFIGKNGGHYANDPQNRITIPGVIKNIENQTNGLLSKNDFFPLPCSNPECVSLTYLLKLPDNSYIPFPRFLDIKKYLHLLGSSATLPPDGNTENALHEIINDLWSSAGEVPDSARVCNALRQALSEIYSGARPDYKSRMRASEKQAKSIFIHHYMDRYNFDLARVSKCCHHYPRADGRTMPICAFNLFHREKEKNNYAFEG